MHPLLRARGAFLLYILLWAGLAIVPYSLIALPGEEGTALFVSLGTMAAFGLTALPSYALCASLPLDGGRRFRSGLVVLLAALSMMLGYRWLIEFFLALVRVFEPEALVERRELALYGTGALFSLFALGLNYLLLALEARRRSDERETEARLLASKAKLDALRAQVHPHFLFNSLNTISSLIGSSPERARDACVLLADFLRSTLRAQDVPWVRLSDEWSLCENYLRIEAHRFEGRIETHVDVEPVALAAWVPSLLLQPLVENAVRHGLALLDRPSPLFIEGRVRQGRLLIRIENDFDPEARASTGGLGLRNVRARLGAHYGDEAILRVCEGDSRYSVTLDLPMDAERTLLGRREMP